MNLSADVESRLIEAVRDIAREEILSRFRRLDPSLATAKSRPDDLVTEADRATERRLERAAAEILPGTLVVGEEAVAERPALRDGIAAAESCLIVDPVDGTWNFAHGLATFGVILALAERGRTVWGMIYDPLGDDWAVARRGQGARLESAGGTRALRFGPREPRPVARALGFVHAYLFRGDERRRLFSVLPDFHKTDALRCSAHEYRLMAQGAVDFCLSPVLNPWDHAAGCLIVEEAGGVARLLDGTPYAPTLTEGRLLVARDAAEWDAFAEVFAPVARPSD